MGGALGRLQGTYFHYWVDMEFHYNFFDPDDEVGQWLADYVQQRNAFGSPIGSYQNTRFKLADLKSDLAVGWAYVDQCLGDHINRELTTNAASTAKLWITEMHGRLVDQCLQFFGGYGFMREYEICRLYADARVLRIYGGTSEIMRELISRNL
jgi:long-chain-acyl-CoA dehydrogenase